MTVLSLLNLLFSIVYAHADNPHCEGSMSAAAIVGFVFGGIIVGLLLIGMFTACMACYRTRLRQRRDKMLTTSHETHPSLGPTSAHQLPLPEPTSSYESHFSPHPLDPPSLSFYDTQSQSYPITNNTIYPSLSGYIHQNPMTVPSHSIQFQPECPVEPRIERQNAVFAAAPIASLESIPNEDLSDGSIYHRFFGSGSNIPKSSPAPSSGYPPLPLPPPPPLPRPPPPPPPISPTTSSNIARSSRISNILRDAARLLRLGGDSHQHEDTVILEDANSSAPSGVASTTQSNLSGSQVRLFKQQRRPKRSSTMGAGLDGSRIGGRKRGRRKRKRSKVSAVTQDSGHCNIFDVTELDEMESSADNDHFLLSLESAVFTTAPTCGAVTTAVAPLYSPTFEDGDLGDAGSVGSGLGGWKEGLLLYPPLPPGSPVVGFAYLGLGGMDECAEAEDETVEVEKGDWRMDEVDLHEEIHQSASTIGTDWGCRVATPSQSEEEEKVAVAMAAAAAAEETEAEVRLRGGCKSTIEHRSFNHRYLNSHDSESSATAMLPTALSLRHSVSVSDLEVRPPSTHLEAWMGVSDEHLLISPAGDEALPLRSQAKGVHLLRSLSSGELPPRRKWKHTQ